MADNLPYLDIYDIELTDTIHQLKNKAEPVIYIWSIHAFKIIENKIQNVKCCEIV